MAQGYCTVHSFTSCEILLPCQDSHVLPGALIEWARRIAGAPAAVLPLRRADLHFAPQLRAHAGPILGFAECCAACSFVCAAGIYKHCINFSEWTASCVQVSSVDVLQSMPLTCIWAFSRCGNDFAVERTCQISLCEKQVMWLELPATGESPHRSTISGEMIS